MSRPYLKVAIKKQYIAAQAGREKNPSSRLLRNRLKRPGKAPEARALLAQTGSLTTKAQKSNLLADSSRE